MSEQGEEGQTPGAPGSEAGGGLPPRPTVRESLRRGLFVRLPTEGESGEGLPGSEQPAEVYDSPEQVDQYGEVPAEEYPGWRQLPDGSWEEVSAEAHTYAEGYDPTPAEAYPEIDAGASIAPVAESEPLSQPGTSEESAWSFTTSQEAAVTPEAGIVEHEQVAPEEVPAAGVEVAEPEPATVEQTPAAVAPEAAPAPSIERAQTRPAMPEDPVAASGLYIPAGVELLEGDMPVYGEKENVPPLFAGSGLGEPLFVEFGDLARMLIGLRRLLPTGTRLTYNYDYERAWVRASAEVDLPSFAERVRTLASEDEGASG